MSLCKNCGKEARVHLTDLGGALFDISKFNDVCRNVIATLSSDEIYNALAEWSAQYDKEFHDLITKYRGYTIKVLSIGRGSNKPRKGYANWSDVKPAISYFYDEFYSDCFVPNCWPEAVSKVDAVEIIRAYINIYDETNDNTV
ncbi:MAG TPA: hypothetical protein PK733_10595 [Clostridiales bacterium]|nr:hypothetical protein [Clostridiales bacterium]